MGAAISGHWDLEDTGTSRDYDALVRRVSSAARFSSQAYRSKKVTFSPVGHARLPIWLRPLTAKGANNQGENVHISNSTTPIVLILVSGDS